LVTYLVDQVGGNIATYSPLVNIPAITRDLAKRPGTFCMGALHARVEGYGNSLRSLALYGNDLAESKLFFELLPQITPFRVHLRDVRLGYEVLSIGSKGEVGFFYRAYESLKDVDRALTYLTQGGYLSWPFGEER
jgi:hypothetical protein